MIQNDTILLEDNIIQYNTILLTILLEDMRARLLKKSTFPLKYKEKDN